MNNHTKSLLKIISKISAILFLFMSHPHVAVAADQNMARNAALPNKIVIKLEIGHDGTPGAIYSVTPVSSETQPADADWQKIIDSAEKTERQLVVECEGKISQAIQNLHRISRSVGRHEIEKIKLETVRQCNIPCAEKMKYGFTRYDSLARVQNSADRTIAGKNACADVDPDAPMDRDTENPRWVYSRRFADVSVVGRGQYLNQNWPLFGLYYNSYNPYGNPYFPFNPYPYVWHRGRWAWYIYWR